MAMIAAETDSSQVSGLEIRNKSSGSREPGAGSREPGAVLPSSILKMFSVGRRMLMRHDEDTASDKSANCERNACPTLFRNWPETLNKIQER